MPYLLCNKARQGAEPIAHDGVDHREEFLEAELLQERRKIVADERVKGGDLGAPAVVADLLDGFAVHHCEGLRPVIERGGVTHCVVDGYPDRVQAHLGDLALIGDQNALAGGKALGGVDLEFKVQPVAVDGGEAHLALLADVGDPQHTRIAVDIAGGAVLKFKIDGGGRVRGVSELRISGVGVNVGEIVGQQQLHQQHAGVIIPVGHAVEETVDKPGVVGHIGGGGVHGHVGRDLVFAAAVIHLGVAVGESPAYRGAGGAGGAVGGDYAVGVDLHTGDGVVARARDYRDIHAVCSALGEFLAHLGQYLVVEAVALSDKLRALDGVKELSLHFLIFVGGDEIPNAAPEAHYLKNIGDKGVDDLVEEAELLRFNEPVVILLPPHAVLDEAEQAFLIEGCVTGGEVVGKGRAADGGDSHNGVVNVVFKAEKVEIGCGDLTAVADCEDIHLILAAVFLNGLYVFVKLSGAEFAAHSEIAVEVVYLAVADVFGDFGGDILLVAVAAARVEIHQGDVVGLLGGGVVALELVNA